MSLVFSAIVPHNPILIPQIGKENIKKFAATNKAYLKLASELKKARVDTILIISPHGIINPNNFTLNLNPKFQINFNEFGDFTTDICWQGDIGLAYKIREQLETKAPVQLTSVENLDYGSAVPLYILLGENIGPIKIIPLYYSELPNKNHYEFGKLLKKELLNSEKRIAVLASGELSHRVNKEAPAGYSPKGKKFDKKLIDLILNKKNQDIVNLDDALISEAGECGLKSIIILCGILKNIEYEPQLLSYEAPFGVGYAVMNLKI